MPSLAAQDIAVATVTPDCFAAMDIDFPERIASTRRALRGSPESPTPFIVGPVVLPAGAMS